MATSGRVNSSKAKSSYVYCKWSQESQSVSGNSTKISWTAGIHVGDGNKWYSNAVKITGVWINGEKVWSGGTYSNLTSGGDKAKKSGTFTIPHNADGTKSFSVKITGWFYSYGNKSGSDTFTLTTIPRASTPTKAYSTVNCGSTQTIYTNRASSSFTHTVKIDFGNQSITQTSVGASWAVVIPASWASVIPNATSGTATVSCTTYSGSTNVGTKTTTFTISVPSDYIPTFDSPEIDIEEAGEIPIDFASITSEGKFIQSLSKLNITPHGIGVYGSTIKQYETTVNGKTYSSTEAFISDIINANGDLSVSLKETDSRDRTNNVDKNILVVPYSAPVINYINYIQDDGEISVNIKGSLSSVEDNNKCSLTIRYRAYGSSEFTDIIIYDNEYIYDINVNYNITDSSITKSTPYELQALLGDVVYNIDTSSIVKSVITNLPTKLVKSNIGYMTFTLGGNAYVASYLQPINNILWSDKFDTNIPNTFMVSQFDKSLNRNVGYTSDKKMILSGQTIYDFWQINSVNESINDITTAFNKAVAIGDNNIYYYDTSLDLVSKALPETCEYIVGNDINLYIISENGNVYYISSLDDDWHELVLEQKVEGISDSSIITLKDIAPISDGKFIATSKTLIGIVNTNNGWKIVSAPIVSLR